MNFMVKLFLFRTFMALLCILTLLVVAGLRVKNLPLIFTLMVGFFALFDSNFQRSNKNLYFEWIEKRPEKIELMTQAHDKIINIEKYLSIFMFLLSIVLIVYHPIKTGGFLRPNNLVGLITIVIGIVLFFSSEKLVKVYFPEVIKQPWLFNSFKFSSVIVAVVGIAMILLLKF